jgi:hypothetical protein
MIDCSFGLNEMGFSKCVVSFVVSGCGTFPFKHICKALHDPLIFASVTDEDISRIPQS